MHFHPSISAVLLAHNHDDQAAHYSRNASPPTHAVMYNYLKGCFGSLTTQGREIQSGVDVIRQKLEDSEMAELRTSEYLQTLIHYDSALTHTKRLLTD
jgi:hypothetical protein